MTESRLIRNLRHQAKLRAATINDNTVAPLLREAADALAAAQAVIDKVDQTKDGKRVFPDTVLWTMCPDKPGRVVGSARWERRDGQWYGGTYGDIPISEMFSCPDAAGKAAAEAAKETGDAGH